jgi:hypothetical protein
VSLFPLLQSLRLGRDWIAVSEDSKEEQQIYIPRTTYKSRWNNPDFGNFWRRGYSKGSVMPNNVYLGISRPIFLYNTTGNPNLQDENLNQSQREVQESEFRT